MSNESDSAAIAKQGRFVALVIAGTMLFWIVAQWLGPQIGLAGRFAILIDLFVLAALLWSMIVTVQMWRRRQSDKG